MKYLLPIFMLLVSCSNPTSSSENNSTNQLSSQTENSKDMDKTTEPIKKTPANIFVFSDSSFQHSYRFENSTQTMPLYLSLMEISGISFFPPTNQLVAINDERGYIFFLNLETGKVEEKVTFSGNGDYEGITWMGGERIAVVSSRGRIFVYDMKNKEAEKPIKTKLNSSNDVEGLAFDADKYQLLLALKGNPNVEKSDKYKKLKNIYRYNLEKGKLKKKPLLSIADIDLENFVKLKSEGNDFSKKELKKMRNRVKDFSPSGIAIHPITKDYYILSSVGKTLLIYSSQKVLQSIILLDAKEHRQPEGICFLPNGDLFISNEGKGFGAKLMRYNFLKK